MADLALPPLRDLLHWLRWQRPNQVLGYRFDPSRCAMTTWLLTVFPGPIVLDEDTVTIGLDDGTTQVWPTPEDYRAAMHQLDYLGGDERTIRVEDARGVLADVVREYQEED